MDDASFSEIIEVSLDLSAVQQQLNELASTYQDALKQMSADGAGLNLSNSMFGDFGKQIQALESELTDFATTFQDALNGIASNIASVTSQAAQRVSESAESARDAGMDSRVSDISALSRQANADARASSRVAKENPSDETRAAATAAAEAAQRVADAFKQAQAAAKGLNESLLADAEAAARLSAEAAAVARNLAEQQSSNPISKIIRGALSDIPELLAGVVRVQLAWQAVGAVVSAIGAVIKAPFEAIGQGLEYLNAMQDKADQLTGVFASSAKFSTDMRENLRQSAAAAADVVQQLREVAAAKNLNFDSLFNAMKSLSANGAGSLTDGSMQSMVDLATRFAVVVKAARGDLNTQRVILSQIPNLLTGQVTGVNQLLQMLGITDAKWNDIVAHARSHRDLLQQLEPFFAPYVAELATAQEHQTELKQQLGLMVNEIEAHLAQGLWEEWTAQLRAANQWIRDNKDQLDAIAGVVGQVATDSLKLASALFQAAFNSGSLEGGLGKAAVVLATMAASVDALVRGLTAGTEISSKFGAVFDQRDHGLAGLAHLSTFWGDISKINAQYTADSAAAQKQLDDLKKLLAGGKVEIPPAPPQYNSSPTWTHPAPEKPKNTTGEELSNAHSLMEQQLANAEQVRKKKEDDAKYEFDRGRINEQQLHDIKMAALREEEAAVKRIGGEYKSVVNGIKGLDTSKRNTALTQASTQQTRTLTELSGEEMRADDTLANQQREAQQRAMQADIEEYRRMSQIKIQEAKQSGKSLHEIAVMEAAARQHEYEMEEAAVRKQIDSIKADNAQKAALIQQYQNLVANQSEQAYADRGKITDAVMEDNVQGREQRYHAEADPMQERLQRMRETMPKDATHQQRQALADLAAQYAVVVQQMAVFLQTQVNVAKATGASAEEVKKLTDALEKQQKLAGQAANAAVKDERTATTGKAGDLENLLFGENVTHFSQFGQGTNGDFDFGTAIKQLNHAFDTFSQSAKTIAVAFEGHNALAGAGAATSTFGSLASAASQSMDENSAIGQMLGVLGPIGSIAGGIMNLFSSIFTAEAQHIAQEISKAFQETVTAYQNGAATLTSTLQQVEAQRQQAINQLSGQKGGQDKLDQLLPQLDQEIASLQAQQQQIIEQFETNVQTMMFSNGLSSSPLGSLLQTWDEINSQVQQYISAGGQAEIAQQALALTLKQMATDAWQNLNSGEQQAISTALNLNQLLQQRIDLENQYQQQVNQLLGQDSIQRRASEAVSSGMQIQTLTQNYQLQLQQLNAQIALGQQQLDLYRQIYDIKTSTVDLEAQQNAANIAALQKQIDMLKQYQEIWSNITPNAQGQYQMNPGFATNIGAVQITINGTDMTAQQLTDSITRALEQSSRSGTGSQFVQYFND